jgi:hypothetical protein
VNETNSRQAESAGSVVGEVVDHPTTYRSVPFSLFEGSSRFATPPPESRVRAVRVHRLRAQESGGRVRRSLLLTSDSGEEHSCSVTVPAEMAPASAGDATGPLAFALLVAMRSGEDLVVDGEVCPHLGARLDRIHALYRSFGPGLRRVQVEIASELGGPAGEGPREIGCFFSRGVDSSYAAAVGRSLAGPIQRLVFVDGFEPWQEPEARTEERRLAAEAARRLGLPLAVVEARLRAPADAVHLDWDDGIGAALAWVAHSLAGGIRHMVIPSTDSVHTLGPCGTSPLLDPLLGSGAVSLVAERPDLLPYLRVCWAESRADNCSQCENCLLAMCMLRAAGGLERATGFAGSLDLERVASLSAPTISLRFALASTARAAAAGGDRALERALLESLERPPALARLSSGKGQSFRQFHSDVVLELAVPGIDRGPDATSREGVPPDGATESGPPSAVRGLVRCVDRRGARHLYGAGWLPPGQFVGELGALLPQGIGADVAVWIDTDGSVSTPSYVPVRRSPRVGAVARFVTEPLGFAHGGPVARAAAVAGRALDLALSRRRSGRAHGPAALGQDGEDQDRAPAGFLYTRPGPDRIALYSALHPIIGDQLLSNYPTEPDVAGYVDVTLLGYLDARAPVTGSLGVTTRPPVPWAPALGPGMGGRTRD